MSDGDFNRAPSVMGRAFLLRVWLTAKDETLRVSVRDVDTGEHRVFGDLQDFAEWLRVCLD